MGKAGIAIVYRDALFARGLVSLLQAEGAVEIRGIIAAEAAAPDQLLTLEPALVILEGDPPESERAEFLDRILQVAPYVVEVGLNRDSVAVHRRTSIPPGNRFVSLVARLARRAHWGGEEGKAADTDAGLTPEEGST